MMCTQTQRPLQTLPASHSTLALRGHPPRHPGIIHPPPQCSLGLGTRMVVMMFGPSWFCGCIFERRLPCQ